VIDSSRKVIDLEDARAIAERNAFTELEPFSAGKPHVLADGQLEAEACWMFFKSEEILVPPEATLGIKWAYVVSKRGAFSMVQDFSDNPVRLRAYLEELSEYFKRRGE